MSLSILLIDDDDDELPIMEAALKKLGIEAECRQIHCPLIAIEAACLTKPDYIFIDYNMPKMDGIECAGRILRSEGMGKTRVILYSNFISNEARRTADDLHLVACIKKPSSVSLLSNQLQILLMQ